MKDHSSPRSRASSNHLTWSFGALIEPCSDRGVHLRNNTTFLAIATRPRQTVLRRERLRIGEFRSIHSSSRTGRINSSNSGRVVGEREVPISQPLARWQNSIPSDGSLLGMPQIVFWVIRPAVCSIANWVNGTDLCPNGNAFRERLKTRSHLLKGNACAVRRPGSQQVEYDCRTRKCLGMWARAKR